MIKDLPGDILEFGVFKGSSLIRFLTFRAILENNYARKIFALIHLKDFHIKKEIDNQFKKNLKGRTPNFKKRFRIIIKC